MTFIIVGILVAIFYFPIVWTAEYLGGEKAKTFSIILMVLLVLFLVMSAPLACYFILTHLG